MRLRQLRRDLPSGGLARVLRLMRDLLPGAKMWFEVLDDFGHLRAEQGCDVAELVGLHVTLDGAPRSGRGRG